MWSWYIRRLPRVPYQLSILSKVPINFREIELNPVSSRNRLHKHNIGFAVLGMETAFRVWLLFTFHVAPLSSDPACAFGQLIQEAQLGHVLSLVRLLPSPPVASHREDCFTPDLPS